MENQGKIFAHNGSGFDSSYNIGHLPTRRKVVVIIRTDKVDVCLKIFIGTVSVTRDATFTVISEGILQHLLVFVSANRLTGSILNLKTTIGSGKEKG